ncbi:MAG TPA: hypothetical protein VMP10_01385 [Chloroflexota bacterium]|nr:hypothetical protein [Chloroflexota bacterium]
MSLIPGVGAVTGFWQVLREINPQNIIDEAEQLVSVELVGRQGSGRQTIATALAGHPPHPQSSAWRALQSTLLAEDGSLPDEVPTAHLFLYVLDATRGFSAADRTPARHLSARGRRIIYVVNKMDLVDRPGSVMLSARRELGLEQSDEVVFLTATDQNSIVKELIPAIVRTLPDMGLALARTLPTLREPIADRLIVDTSRANGEFALASSLPANIPLLGTFLSAGTDMIVLTKNQAMLVFKLAAIYGRSLHSRSRLAIEIAPVVGAAFVWRTIARTLVGLLPGFIAAVPKTGVAFAGTFVVGRTAQYYYQWNRRPSPELVRKFGDEARQMLIGRFTRLLPGRG